MAHTRRDRHPVKSPMICSVVLVWMSLIGAPLSPLFSEAEDLWAANKFTDSNRVLDELLASDPKNSEALWRVARNFYDMGESLSVTAKDERFRLYTEVENYGKKCREADPKDGNCDFWIGVGIGRQGTTRGLLTQIRNAKRIRDLWLTAIRHAPPYRSRDGTADIPGDIYLALGIYYRLIPDWWIMQVVMGVRGDIDDSVEYLRKSVALEPRRIEYLKELGVSLICRGTKEKSEADIEEGRANLRDLQGVPPIKPYDGIDKEHALLILSDPQMACGYSRDGQQEISEKEALKAFEKMPPRQ